jgi:hypothetical protein
VNTGAYQKLTDMLDSRALHGIVKVNRAVYCFGNTHDVNTAEVYYIDTESRYRLPNLPLAKILGVTCTYHTVSIFIAEYHLNDAVLEFVMASQIYNKIQTNLTAGYKNIVSNGESLFVIGEKETHEITSTGVTTSTIPSGFGSLVLHVFVKEKIAYY